MICSTDDIPTRELFYEWVVADDSLLMRYETAIHIRTKTRH